MSTGRFNPFQCDFAKLEVSIKKILAINFRIHIHLASTTLCTILSYMYRCVVGCSVYSIPQWNLPHTCFDLSVQFPRIFIYLVKLFAFTGVD